MKSDMAMNNISLIEFPCKKLYARRLMLFLVLLSLRETKSTDKDFLMKPAKAGLNLLCLRSSLGIHEYLDPPGLWLF